MRPTTMKRWSHAALVAGFVLGLMAWGPPPAEAQQPPADFTGIVTQKAPAVVAITTKQMVEAQTPSIPDDTPFGDLFRGMPRQQPQAREALGSGFIISQDGYIVTNNHVIDNASEIHVVFDDHSSVPAKLVGHDPLTDIAVLKIDPRPHMSVVGWGNSDAMQPGAWTIAIGSPYGLGGTVTVGVLSARSRNIHAGPYDDFLQTDASINRGNSGGPLFNVQGEVIGVNTAIFSPSGGNIGIGFAVPSNVARPVVEQLIQTGHVQRGFLGVRVQDLTPAIAKALGLQEDSGALVASVESGSPADRAGLKTGDVITRLNGKTVQGARDLTRAVASIRPGSSGSVTVFRNGHTQDINVAVGQRGEEQDKQGGTSPQPDQGKRLGVSLAPLTDEVRRSLGIQNDVSGVLVQQVEPDSPASDNGIKSGDIIVAANNQDVSQPSDVADAWAKSRQQNRPVLLRIRRDGQYLFVAAGP